MKLLDATPLIAAFARSMRARGLFHAQSKALAHGLCQVCPPSNLLANFSEPNVPNLQSVLGAVGLVGLAQRASSAAVFGAFAFMVHAAPSSPMSPI